MPLKSYSTANEITLKCTLECWTDRLPMPLSNSSSYSFCRVRNWAHLAVAQPKHVRLCALIFFLGSTSVGNFDCTILSRRKTSKRTALFPRIHNNFSVAHNRFSILRHRSHALQKSNFTSGPKKGKISLFSGNFTPFTIFFRSFFAIYHLL